MSKIGLTVVSRRGRNSNIGIGASATGALALGAAASASAQIGPGIRVTKPASVNADGDLEIQTDDGIVKIRAGEFTQIDEVYYVDWTTFFALETLIQQAITSSGVLAAAGAGAAALAGGAYFLLTGDDDLNPQGTIIDTGSSATDGVTNNGTVGVTGVGSTWEYSLDGGVTWQTGTGSSFTLPDGTYAAGDIQIRTTDSEGTEVVSTVNSGQVIVDTAAPTVTTPGGTNNVAENATGTLATVIATDANGPVTYSLDAASVAAGFSIDANGNITNVNGLDFETATSHTITVTATDAAGNTITDVVTLNVSDVNEAPTAVDDTATTAEDTGITITVLANDSDPENAALTVTITSGPSNGTATVNGSGQIIYTPNADYNGLDSITYQISDGTFTDTATVSLTVTPENDPPVSVNDSVTTAEDTPATITVLTNDTDVDGDTLTVSITAGPSNGTASVNASGQIIYTPDADYNGTDSLTYTVSDGNGGTDTATVSITVTAVNDAPDAVNDTITVAEDTVSTITVLTNDSDVDGDTLTVTIAGGPSNGTATVNASGQIVYTPNANFSGSDSLTYTVSDGNGGTDTATVNITVSGSNDAPTAADDTATTAEDTPVTISVLANDNDLDGDSLTVTIAGGPSNGTATVNASGQIVYTPNADFNGSDSLTYLVDDGNGGTDTATVNITVTAVNDAPDAANDAATTAEDTPVTITVLTNDSDVEGDTLTVTIASGPSNGTATVNASGQIVYTPNADYNGADSLTYTVSDGNGGTDTATVNITVTATNDAPTAADDTATTAEDTPVTISVLANDSDLDGDSLTVTITGGPSNGTATVNASGQIVYTPNADYNGADSLTYTISDGNGGTDTATVNITVTAVNDAPTAADKTVTTDEDVAYTFSAADFGFSDVDTGDTLSKITITAAPSAGTLAIGGVPITSFPADVTAAQLATLTFTPAADANGAGHATITFTVNDGSDDSVSTNTITVDVTAVNDAPDAVDDNETAVTQVLTNLDVLGNDSDPENDSLTITAVGAGSNGGTIAIAAGGGSINYTSANGFVGTETFTYTVSDGNGGTDTATVTVAVSALPPVTDSVTEGDYDTMTATGSLGSTPTGGASSSNGTYGSFVIAADGTYTYVLDKTATVTALDVGETLTDSIQINTAAGLVTLEITINGAESEVVFTGHTATVVEGDKHDAALTATGTVVLDDLDNNDDPTAVTVNAGTYTSNWGSVTINAAGVWTYTLEQDKVQHLKSGENFVDEVYIELSDGSFHAIEVTVQGTTETYDDTYFVDTSLYSAADNGFTWHLSQIGRVSATGDNVWDRASGIDVTMNIVDDGIQSHHEDLAANYDATGEIPGYPAYQTGPDDSQHGTSVAGVAAAVGQNGTGVIGVAYNSTITGTPYLADLSFASAAEENAFYTALFESWSEFDVINNSWGAGIYFLDGRLFSSYDAAQDAAVNGRGGLGSIFVKSSGNEHLYWGNTFADSLNSLKETITVGAIQAIAGPPPGVSLEGVSNYSSRGFAVLVSAPSNGDTPHAIATTDRGEGDDAGYNNTGSLDFYFSADENYTSGFGGTSSAAPVISGVAALMLDANPDLGWRDVKDIFAYSSTYVGSGAGATGADEEFAWLTNGASNWNGGGLHVSGDYGYGNVNAHNAVALAETWLLTGNDARVSANEESFTLSDTANQVINTAVNGGTVSYSFTLGAGQNMVVEHLNLAIDWADGDHASDFKIEIIDPNGTRFTVVDPDLLIFNGVVLLEDEASALASDLFGVPVTVDTATDLVILEIEDVNELSLGLPGISDWEYGLEPFRGTETATGDTWTVEITDTQYFDNIRNIDNAVPDPTLQALGLHGPADQTSTIEEVSLTFSGRADTDDDTYYYTDEFATMLAADPSRANLNDGAGIDTINAAAVTMDLVVDGTPGAVNAAAGIVLGATTVIENFISGSGDDTIIGNDAANSIWGRYGADTLDGGNGADILNGGYGNDTLTGGAGADIFVFDNVAGADVITDFEVGVDTIRLEDTGIRAEELYDNLSLGGAGGAALYDDGEISITFTGITSLVGLTDDFVLV